MKTSLLSCITFSVLALCATSCLSSGDDTIMLEEGRSNTDIPSDSKANPNPDIYDSNASIPNIQCGVVDEDGTAVVRIDMTGIQDKSTLEWLRLLGTGEKNQNVWVEIDGKPKGIKVYNTADDDNQEITAIDLVFLVDNSGSMSEEADAIARDIINWASLLKSSGLDVMFGCVGYNGAITGACSLTSVEILSEYLNHASGTNRTVGFTGVNPQALQNVANNYRTGGGSSNECGMAALRFADENFKFRTGSNRIYVNFTDEPNQPAGISRFSVESLLTNWESNQGTIHTVFSGGREYGSEYNYKMSEYTGGTVMNTDGYFTNVSLTDLPVSSAMRNSYIIRFTNVEEYIDGKPHTVHVTIMSPDGKVRAERYFNVIFTRTV